MPAVTHLWVSCYERKITSYLFKPPQSGSLLFATLMDMPNNRDNNNSYHSLNVCYKPCTMLCVLCVLISHFILMATLWNRHCYSSSFVDKETEALSPQFVTGKSPIILPNIHITYRATDRYLWSRVECV